MTVWTIGHGTRSLRQLIEALASFRIAALVDVRTIPRSRYNPQFDRDTLPTALGESRITYVHLGALGGLRRPRPDSANAGLASAGFRGYADHMQTEEFRAGLDALLDLVARGRSAVMCAERSPLACHRSLLADAIVARGVAVEHILETGGAQSHQPSAAARVEDGRVTYPRSVTQREFFED